MLKKVTLICLFIVCKIGLAQSYEIYNSDTINFIDAAGKKQNYWIIFGKMKKLPGYKDDQKVEEGRYKDNLKTGKWTEYYANSNKKSEITFDQNRANGYATMYYENGQKAEEGLWKNNKWVGDYKLYYENGKVQQEFTFNATGKREGKQVYYYEDGKKMIEGEWKDGKESGTVIEYYPTGEKKSEKNYANGVLDVGSVKTFEPSKPQPPKKEDKDLAEEAPKDGGKASAGDVKDPGKTQDLSKITGKNIILYNKDRQVSKSGDFENGKLIRGKSYTYKDGILVRIALYENGRYKGDAPLTEKDK